MELDGDLDPDEYCKERGSAAYQQRLNQAQNYFYWLADRARKKHDVHTPDGVVAVLQSLVPSVQRISDRLERMAVANDLASYIGVDRGIVLDHFRKTISDRQNTPLARPPLTLRADERLLLNAVLGEPDSRSAVIQELRSIEAIAQFSSRRIFQTVFALDSAGQGWTFEEVHARLEPSDQNLLAEAVLRDDSESNPQDVLAAIDSIRRTQQQQEVVRLRARIRELERAGNLEEAIRLMAELPSLERSARSRK